MPGGMIAVHDLFWLALAALFAFGNFVGGLSGVYMYVLWGKETFAHDFSEVGAVYRSYAPICYAQTIPTLLAWLRCCIYNCQSGFFDDTISSEGRLMPGGTW